MRIHARLAITSSLLLLVAASAHAQSSRNRLPPKQDIVHVAPPRPSPPPPPAQQQIDQFAGSQVDLFAGAHVDYFFPNSSTGSYGSAASYTGYAGYGAAFVSGGGLQSRLFAPMQGRIRFVVSQPAYVAMFEIQPGRGVRVIFPDDWAAERQLATGFHEPPLPTGGDALGGQYPSTRWLYLVTSDRPLGLLPQKRSVNALESLMGAPAFRSTSTYDVTTAIRQKVLSLGGAWTEAMVGYRPGMDQMVSAGGGVATVRCSNGVVYSVRAGERFECP